MKTALIATAALAISVPTLAQAQGSNSVRGYFRSDGTYVQPHYRTNPNRSTYDNWSTKPNYNPYTGQQGTRTPSYGYTAPRPAYESTWGRSARPAKSIWAD